MAASINQGGVYGGSSGISAPANQRYNKWHKYSVSISSTRCNHSSLGHVELLSLKQNRLKVLASLNEETSVLEARSIHEIYDALAQRLLPVAAMISEPHSKYIVGIAGPPGAGKSTLAAEVANRVNMLWPNRVSTTCSQIEGPNVATVLPMDGFHLYRSQLDKMEDPKEAHARRGAPWTFDPDRLLTCLKALRSQGSVYAPSFDHGVGDPVEGDILVSFHHKVVIVEGNYLLLNNGAWKEISAVFDEKWFIEVDIDKAMQRVQRRHVLTGKTPEIAKWRIEYNDRPNAELIAESRKCADLVIKSVDM